MGECGSWYLGELRGLYSVHFTPGLLHVVGLHGAMPAPVGAEPSASLSPWSQGTKSNGKCSLCPIRCCPSISARPEASGTP